LHGLATVNLLIGATLFKMLLLGTSNSKCV